MTTFRYRQLSQTGEGEAATSGRTRRGRAYSTATDKAGAVFEVASVESEATYEALLQMLRSGELSPSRDLVFSRGSWTPFEHSPEFFDALDDVVDHEQRAQKWRSARIVLTPVVPLVLYLLYRFWSR